MFRRRKNYYNHDIEIEEIFIDKYATDKKIDAEFNHRKLEVPLEKRSFTSFFVAVFCLAIFLALFTFYLQIKKGEEYMALAKQNKFVMTNLKSERGIIYDRNMKQLVWNEAGFDLMANKEILNNLTEPEKEKSIQTASVITGESFSNIASAISATTSQETKITAVKNLNHQSLVLVEAKKENLPGFFIQKRILRHYEKTGSLGHILGYLGKISQEEFSSMQNYEIGDYIGKQGIEKYYEDFLKEQKGKVQIERNAQGQEISREIVSQPESGNSMKLNLDLGLQKKIEESLKAVIDEVGSGRGVVVALDPRNGGVIASVSLPALDNNLFSAGISQEDLKKINEDENNPQLNRAIQGLYPTGSTIKPFMGIAALEENVIEEDTQLYCPAKLCLVNQYTGAGECFPDWKFHGTSDIKRAIAESVNPFFYMIGGGYTAPKKSSEFYDERLPKNFKGLGALKIAEYLERFGFGATTNIDLTSESKGRVPTPEWKEKYFRTAISQKWYQGDTYNLSIGQGYLLGTPLQLASAYSAIANNGKLLEPRFAKEILAANGKEKQIISPKIIRENFVNQKSLDIIKQGMRQAVTSPSGSAYSLNNLPVAVAAKTGTAQIYSNKEIYLNWIAVFAPYDNPEIVMVVLIEDVPGLRASAQRVARESLDWYFYTRLQEE